MKNEELRVKKEEVGGNIVFMGKSALKERSTFLILRSIVLEKPHRRWLRQNQKRRYEVRCHTSMFLLTLFLLAIAMIGDVP